MRFAITGLVIALPLLTSCASVAPMTVSKENQGLLMLRLTPNELPGNMAKGAWGTISLSRIDGEGHLYDPFQLIAREQTFVQDVLYAGVFEAGRYAISSMTLANGSFIQPGYGFGHFEIKPGQVTYLGHMIQLNDYERNTVLVARNTGMPSLNEAMQLVDESFPDHYPMLENGVVGWSDIQSESLIKLPMMDQDSAFKKEIKGLREMDRRYTYIRANASGYLSPLELPDGDLLFGSLLGTVKRWHPGGEIDTYSVGATNAVATLVRLQDGSILAGGDTAFLSLSRDEGKTWSLVTHNIPFGVITELLEASDGRIFATLLTNGQIRVFAGVLGRKEWKQLAAFPGNWRKSSRLALDPKLVLQGEKLLVVLPQDKIGVINTQTGEITARALPGSAQDFSIGKDGEMLCLCGPESAFIHSYQSRDYGVTWSQIPTPKTSGLPRFRDGKHGVILQTIPFIDSSKLFVTEDGGATWTPAASAEGGRLIGYTLDGKTLMTEGKNGRVYYSQDDGRSWDPIGRRN